MITRNTYHPLAKFCHWTIVLVVAGQFVSSWFSAEPRHGQMPNIFNTIHVSGWSFLVIPLAGILLFMRFYRPVAKTEMEQRGLLEATALAMQYVLYILLFVVPLSGWAMASFRGAPISFLGLFDLPVLSVVNPSYLFTLGRLHGTTANLLGILALGHAGAALYHHFVLKDEVLNRMRPSHGNR